ncbi:hypothetical protein LTR53_000013 [Teratosphaeriaceae sp. CCFEE 6253]|nr:hypothetical protein LTR53_000013 [Teratosphaeriaceae sp. CCFEE 6253]
MRAGVVYCTRVLAIKVILPSEQQEVQNGADDKRFRQMRGKYLVDGTYNVGSMILSLLAHGKSIALSHNNGGSMSWRKDPLVMSYRSWPISLARIKTMIGDVITEAADKLWTKLMWRKRDYRFEVPLEQFEDGVTFMKRAVSFLTNRARRLADNRGWMPKRAFTKAHTPMVRSYIRVVGGRRWPCKGISVRSTASASCFCSAFTSRGIKTARGSEITTIRFWEVFLHDRNVFVIQGQMVVVTRYHKSQSQFYKPKVILRFLLWKVGQLLAMYLAYVQPLQWYLSEEAGNGGTVWDAVATLDYLHVAISSEREVVSDHSTQGYIKESGTEEAEVDEDDALEILAGRGGEIGANR